MDFVRAGVSDIGVIQDIAQVSWEKAYGDILSSEQIEYMLKEMYSNEELEKQLLNESFRYYLMVNESTNLPQGFMGFQYGYEEKTTKLHKIYILPTEQGKGWGSKAIHFLKEEVEKFGDRRIILNVNKNNNARKAYEKNGFIVEGQEVIDIGEGYVMDDYIMSFSL